MSTILSSLLLGLLLVFTVLVWRGVRFAIALAATVLLGAGVGGAWWLGLVLLNYITLD